MSVKAILYGQSYTKAEMDELLDDVQDSLQFDDIPTVNSNNPVKSGGIYSALSNKQDTLNFDNQPTSNSQRMLTSGSIYTALSTKQNTLTIANSVQQGNNNPVSSGAVYTAIQGLTPEGDLIVVDDELSSTSENPVQNLVIYNALAAKANASDLTDYATVSSLNAKAPTSHASSATTYGVGTDSNYGHLKITDNATNTAATSGIAISPKAVYTLTQTVNGKQDALSSSNLLPVSSGGTGATTFTSGQLLIGNGTNAVSTRAITNNTSNTSASGSTNIPTMNTLYYTLAKINNADQTHATTIYAPTAGGTANTQALVGNGATTAPKWVDISPSITVTAGDASNAPKINVSVLGQSGTAQSITTASTSVYGVTKLTDSYTSSNKTLAATGASILAAIQSLDVSSVGGSGKYISAISETDGKISATATNTSVSNTWVAGTTAGPTIQTTVNGVSGTAVAIPKASDTASGIITTDQQFIRGIKIFETIRVRAKDQNANNQNRRFASIQFYNHQSKIAGSLALDTVGSGGTNFSTDVNYSYSRWQIEELSPKTIPDAESTGYSEIYKLPAVDAGLTANKNYDILTSKNTITIAQGGTGATTKTGIINTIFGDSTTGGAITPDYFLGITSGWSKAGYITINNARKLLLGNSYKTTIGGITSTNTITLTNSDNEYAWGCLIIYHTGTVNGILFVEKATATGGAIWTGFSNPSSTTKSIAFNFTGSKTIKMTFSSFGTESCNLYIWSDRAFTSSMT